MGSSGVALTVCKFPDNGFFSSHFDGRGRAVKLPYPVTLSRRAVGTRTAACDSTGSGTRTVSAVFKRYKNKYGEQRK